MGQSVDAGVLGPRFTLADELVGAGWRLHCGGSLQIKAEFGGVELGLARQHVLREPPEKPGDAVELAFGAFFLAAQEVVDIGVEVLQQEFLGLLHAGLDVAV